jgi:hypothetical protein
MVRDWRTGSRTLTLSLPNSTASTGSSTIDVDVRLNEGPTLAILGVCVIAFFVAVNGASGIWELRRVEGTARRQRVWAWSVLIANLVAAVASIAVLGWTTSVQGEKGWQSLADVGKGDQSWTRETWVCQIDEWFPEQDWARNACGLAVCIRVCDSLECILTGCRGQRGGCSFRSPCPRYSR